MERIITKSFARLMGRGIHRGFITHEELNKSLGKRNLSQENLAQAFIHILDENSQGFSIDDIENVKVQASKVGGQKCQRCWKYEQELIKNEICNRCNDAIS